MRLRDYQSAAVEAIINRISSGPGNTLVDLPTGSGKTVVLGGVAARAIQMAPTARILILTHVKELVQQNYETVAMMGRGLYSTGVYSASLGLRHTAYQVTVASVQSVANRIVKHPGMFGDIDFVMVDECHLISRKGSSTYGKVFAALRIINPHLRVIGLTATPYRMDSGSLVGGDDALFQDICHKLEVRWMVEQGWLTPLRTKNPSTTLDTSGVGMRGGEFIANQLDRAVNVEELTAPICEEISQAISEKGARSILVFGVSISHCENLTRHLREIHGLDASVVHSKISDELRDRKIREFKAHSVDPNPMRAPKILSSMGVLTTGFDAKGVDMIALVRPTQSMGLYVQMMGRGLRPLFPDGFDPDGPGVDAAVRRLAIADGSKPHCIVLDFGTNALRHGPIDDLPEVGRKIKTDRAGDLPAKICQPEGSPSGPGCGEIVHISARECPECGAEFPPPKKAITDQASEAPVMIGDAPKPKQITETVHSATAMIHHKAGKPPSLKITYYVGEGMEPIREFLGFEHGGFFERRACDWWLKHAGSTPPETTQEALDRINEVDMPVKIVKEKKGKYWNVVRSERSPFVPSGSAPKIEVEMSLEDIGFGEPKREEIPF